MRLLLVVLALAACSPPMSGLGPGALQRAEISGIEAGPVELSGGEWEGESVVEGSATRHRMGLVGGMEARGAFGPEGREACAVLVWHHTGGSGTRVWLVVLEDAPVRPRTAAAILLGDRVQVVTLEAEDGALRVRMVGAGEGDAACCPGEILDAAFRLEGDELVGEPVSLGRATSSMLAGPVWRLERLSREGDPVDVEVTMVFDGEGGVSGEAGCNSYAGTVHDSGTRDVSFEVQPTSARRCPERNTLVDQQFLAAIHQVDSFSFLGGKLHLGHGGDALVLAASKE